jgi:cytochrome c55X
MQWFGIGALRALLAGVWMAAVLAPAAAQTADTQPSVEQGRRLYGSYCARCHGVNMVTFSAAFFDLRTLAPNEQERFERSVNQGLRAMPAWGSILKPGDVQALWMFVSSGR